MPPITRVRAFVSLSLIFLFVLAARPAQAQDPLTFFKNYFVTGDYVVRGTSLWRKGVKGVATSNITINGVDEDNVDVLAAFLYVQTAEKDQWSGIDHAKFRGNDLGPGNNSFAKALNWDQATPPCWSFLWRGTRRMVTYRADVLRFLPVKANGKIGVNGLHQVKVPDGGHFYDKDDDDEDDWERPTEIGPRAVGASLVIVYRDPRQPLKSIVIYDGGFTKRMFDTMVQPIKGFYQASSTAPVAKMTHIVGDGSRFLSEKVFFNGTQLVPVNPFVGAEGFKWDDPTFTNLKLAPNADSAVVKVDKNGLLSDCLVYSAIVFSTTVQDTDGDGLLDIWESSVTPLRDPNNQPLPNLHDMGADPNVKDVFTEIAYMTAGAGTSYGGVVKPAHSHLPAESALNMVGEAFAAAPTPVRVHFDVGNNYQHNPPNPFIIPASLARGGKFISETLACPDPVSGQLKECAPDQMPGQYPRYPGTVGWKTGFRFLRDELLGFDRNRKDMFRYVLFAHSLGIPVDACLKPDGVTTDIACQNDSQNHPNFHVPVTNSGIGDFPGGDLLVTLGHFDDADLLPVGSPFMQGSTMMHEWGHTFELTHAGTPTTPREPNCKPNYLSVMNYLFQLRGLPDATGVPRMDFSRENNKAINEFSLVEDPLGSALYRTGWYAPKSASYLKNVGAAALKHCDGSELSQAELDDLHRPDGRGGMVRIDASNVLGPVDWNANGNTPDTAFSQDINFDGEIDGGATHPELKVSPNDWLTLRMNQLGGRRSVGGYYIDTQGRNAVGPMSLDVGRGDIGRGDIGRGDIGRGDIGRGDIGRGDIGRGDIGGGNIGRGDIGRGDIGRGDIGRGLFGGGDTQVGGVDEPFAELSLETALATEGQTPSNDGTPPPPTPPTALAACLTTGADYACATEGGNIPVKLGWQPPHLGSPALYFLYRFTFQGDFAPPADLPAQPIAIIRPLEGGSLPTGYLDFTAPPGSNVAYFVRAQGSDGRLSGISNFATVTTPPLRLIFAQQPAASAVNRPMPPVQVAVQDQFGNPMNVTGLAITMAIGNNPSEATLSGTTTQQTVNGVATFANLSINKAGTGYTLVAMSGTLVPATSQPFNVVEPPVIVTSALPDGTQNAPYSESVAATGGLPPYAWDLKPIPNSTDFTLPDGLTLVTLPDGTGLIAGTPTTVQVRSFRLRVTDSAGQTATQDLCIHIEESHAGTLLATPQNESMTPEMIAKMLVGEGQAISISNVTYTGATPALGTFTGGFGALGLSSGAMLSSGSVANLNPPNNSDSATTENLVPGDADLQKLVSAAVSTFDAAVLEFDFTVTNPQATTVKFDYVFASEEYNEFANSDFNDVFGFFLTGPEYDHKNLALIPNTTPPMPVSINTVNGGRPFGADNAQNKEWFINNDLQDGGGSLGTQADGLTKVLTISATITPNVTYHLKLAIADVADFQYDSWVMIKAGSFAAVCPIIPNCPSCGK